MRAIELTKLTTTRYNDNEEGEGQPTCPVSVFPAAIRCFYPRRNGAPGTRITFIDGGGFVVTEAYDVVRQYIERSALPVREVVG